MYSTKTKEQIRTEQTYTFLLSNDVKVMLCHLFKTLKNMSIEYRYQLIRTKWNFLHGKKATLSADGEISFFISKINTNPLDNWGGVYTMLIIYLIIYKTNRRAKSNPLRKDIDNWINIRDAVITLLR